MVLAEIAPIVLIALAATFEMSSNGITAAVMMIEFMLMMVRLRD